MARILIVDDSPGSLLKLLSEMNELVEYGTFDDVKFIESRKAEPVQYFINDKRPRRRGQRKGTRDWE